MAKIIRESFEGFGTELLGDIRKRASERIDEAVYEEKIVGIKKATAAMMEIGIDEEIIINMLQRYWDLRLSEAKDYIKNAMI